jgi:hypothetical protein
MKIKELKNKIVLAELDPNCSYIMLCGKGFVNCEDIENIQVPSNILIQYVFVNDIDKAVKFIEIPKK